MKVWGKFWRCWISSSGPYPGSLKSEKACVHLHVWRCRPGGIQRRYCTRKYCVKKMTIWNGSGSKWKYIWWSRHDKAQHVFACEHPGNTRHQQTLLQVSPKRKTSHLGKLVRVQCTDHFTEERESLCSWGIGRNYTCRPIPVQKFTHLVINRTS